MNRKAKVSLTGLKSWSREAVVALIEVYKKRTCLYDIKSPAYHNREKNRDALQEMVNVVSKYHPEVTENDCKRKYQGLRSQFSREYARVLKSLKSGGGTEDVIEPKLWCFESLLFLKDSVKTKKGFFFVGVMEENNGLSSDENMVVEVLEEYEEEYTQSQETEIPSKATHSCSLSPEPGSSNQTQKQTSAFKRQNSAIRLTPSPDAIKPRRLLGVSTNTSREQSASPLESAFMASVSNYFEKKRTQPKDKNKNVVFGEFVASRLESIKLKHKNKLEKQICELIFKFEAIESDSD